VDKTLLPSFEPKKTGGNSNLKQPCYADVFLPQELAVLLRSIRGLAKSPNLKVRPLETVQGLPTVRTTGPLVAAHLEEANYGGLVEAVRTVGLRVRLATGMAREARMDIPWEMEVGGDDMCLVPIAKCVPRIHKVGENHLDTETRTGLRFVLMLRPLEDSDGSKWSDPRGILKREKGSVVELAATGAASAVGRLVLLVLRRPRGGPSSIWKENTRVCR
jgi:hypothetical protein